MSMDFDNDDDDLFHDSFADDSFSGEVAPARRRLYNERNVLSSSNASSNRSGAAFCRLLSLQILDLSNNLLTGELPDCWWEMQALQFMDLSNNSFSGEIPKAPPTHNCSLESLHLAGNGFTGDFPSVVQGCGSLATLDIGNNNFHGGIPPWIGSDVQALKILSLKSNKFTGEIPPELSKLPQLQLLDLSHNSLIGSIPKEFGKLISMKNPKINSSTGSLDGSTYQDRIDIIWKGQDLIFQRILELMTGIDLSGNSLSHCIPEELTNLQGLRFLNLSGNNLSCSIPQNIGSFKYLESLDLSLNNLSGAIPPSISSLLSLSKLNLSNNNLSGKIPTGSQLQTLTEPSIYGNNPGLCGFPLDSCTNDSPQYDVRNGRDCDDQWLYYCVIAGIVFGFWLWCGMILSIPKWRCFVFLFVDRMQYNVMLKLQPIDQYLSKEKSDPFL
jgi:Leucine-rich repeat (LRR) protein